MEDEVETHKGLVIQGNFEAYILDSKLQDCLYGSVYRGSCCTTGGCVAVKVLQKRDIEVKESDRELPETPLAEVFFAKELAGHANVFNIREVFESETCHFVVSDLAAGDDLLELLKLHPSGMKEDFAKYFMRQAAEGLAFCHRQGIAMQDFSLENCLLFYGDDLIYQVKICDPGQAVRFSCSNGLERPVSYRGCVGKRFRPPEIFDRNPYNATKVDSWCLGWSTFYLLFAIEMFESTYEEDEDVRWQLLLEQDFHTLFNQLGMADKISDSARDFVLTLLNPDPLKRMSVADALNHPFLSGCPPVVTANELPPPGSNVPQSCQKGDQSLHIPTVYSTMYAYRYCAPDKPSGISAQENIRTGRDFLHSHRVASQKHHSPVVVVPGVVTIDGSLHNSGSRPLLRSVGNRTVAALTGNYPRSFLNTGDLHSGSRSRLAGGDRLAVLRGKIATPSGNSKYIDEERQKNLFTSRGPPMTLTMGPTQPGLPKASHGKQIPLLRQKSLLANGENFAPSISTMPNLNLSHFHGKPTKPQQRRLWVEKSSGGSLISIVPPNGYRQRVPSLQVAAPKNHFDVRTLPSISNPLVLAAHATAESQRKVTPVSGYLKQVTPKNGGFANLYDHAAQSRSTLSSNHHSSLEPKRMGNFIPPPSFPPPLQSRQSYTPTRLVGHRTASHQNLHSEQSATSPWSTKRRGSQSRASKAKPEHSVLSGAVRTRFVLDEGGPHVRQNVNGLKVINRQSEDTNNSGHHLQRVTASVGSSGQRASAKWRLVPHSHEIAAEQPSAIKNKIQHLEEYRLMM